VNYRDLLPSDYRRLNRLRVLMGRIRRDVLEAKKLDRVDPIWRKLERETRLFPPLKIDE